MCPTLVVIVLLISTACELISAAPRFSSRDGGDAGEHDNGRCEPITSPLCRDIPYNMTIMPNIFGHRTQQEAMVELARDWLPLIRVNKLKKRNLAGQNDNSQFLILLFRITVISDSKQRYQVNNCE